MRDRAKEMLTCQLLPASGNGRAQTFRTPPPPRGILHDLMESSLVLLEDWEQLPAAARAEMEKVADSETLILRLVEHGLLTEYQARRIEVGSTFGLVLGNYRILDRLG